MAKSRAFCALTEAQVVPVISLLSCCSRSCGLWGFPERRRRRGLVFRAVHSCSSCLLGGCREELLPTAVSVQSQFFAGFTI